MKHFTRVIVILIFLSGSIGAQDITYTKSNFDKSGEGGTMVTPDVNLSNSGLDSIEVFVNRFYLNLPPNWTSCFCFINCHLPEEDTLRFKLGPGETVTIGVGFNTDTIPGTGYVRLTVEQTGGTQKDTLSFSGSTLVSGLKNFSGPSSFSAFPNPFTSSIIFNTPVECLLSVTDLNGKVVLTESVTEKTKLLDLGNLEAGQYFIRVAFRSGKNEIQKIIKQ